MKLSPFASAVWLIWLSAIAVKICMVLEPSAAATGAWRKTGLSFMRAFIIIVGVTVARTVAEDCPDGINAAGTLLAAVGIAAIVADSLSKKTGVITPGTAAILSAAVVAVSESLARSPSKCYSVQAPMLSATAVAGVALGSVLGRI